MNEPSDQELLRQYTVGRSETAFAALTRRHVNLVYSAALRMTRDPHLAEDVTQAAFLELSRNAAKLADWQVLAGWLHYVARNLAVKHIRADARRRAREQEAAAMSDLLSPETAPPWDAVAPLLDDTLAELEESDRDALLLRYFQRKSAGEMAPTLGISAEAAQKRVTRALERLRRCFARRGLETGAGGLAAVISAHGVQAAPVGLATTITTATTFAGVALTTPATLTATKTFAMTTIQKTLVAAILFGTVGAGLYEGWRAATLQRQVGTLQEEITPLREQLALAINERNRIAAQSSNSVVTPPAKPFDWSSIESPDYKQYIANLRAAGCPEQTIRDIIRTDMNALFEEKKRQVMKAVRFEYWRGDDFIRRSPGREAWIRLLSLDDERDAALRALGIEPHADKQGAKNSLSLSWSLDFLSNEKKEKVLQLRRDLENQLATRPPDSLDGDGIMRRFQEMEDAAKRFMTPEEAQRYEMTISSAAGQLRGRLYGFEPSEQEFAALFPAYKQYTSEVSAPPAGETRAERRARNEATEAQWLEKAKEALGPERYAAFQRAQEPYFHEMYQFATSADLGMTDAIQLHSIRKTAEEQAARLRADQNLTPEERNTMLARVQEEATASLQNALGEKGWEVFNRPSSGQKQWLQNLIPPKEP